MQRHRFGRRAESLPVDQLLLGLEEAEQIEAEGLAETDAERLDIMPAQFRVLVTRRPRYACRACEDVIVQAPAPARLVEGGIPTEASVVHVLVSKYADHLPLHRQAAARQSG